jgi:DNA-binding CsgD family transcriptional regulator
LPPSGDLHIECNGAALRCRALVATGRHEEGVRSCDPAKLDDLPTAPLHAEMLAIRAVALACTGESDLALDSIAQSEKTSPSTLMVQVLGPAVRAIVDEGSETRSQIEVAWENAVRLGNLDAIVIAYRAHPPLLRELQELGGKALHRLLQGANDAQLARRYGMGRAIRATGPAGLTEREAQVLDLVASGSSNRNVAAALFISEATVKVHLRHAYEKLGVRTRTEAVARWLTQQ